MEYASDAPPQPDAIEQIWQSVRPHSDEAQDFLLAYKLAEYAAHLCDTRAYQDEMVSGEIRSTLLGSASAVRKFNQAQRRAIKNLVPELEAPDAQFIARLREVIALAIDTYPQEDEKLVTRNKESWQQVRNTAYSIVRHVSLLQEGKTGAEIEAMIAKKIAAGDSEPDES